MPQEPVTVYYVADGAPMLMHSVDAQEAMRLGDYTLVPPGEPASGEALAAAGLQMRLPGSTIHPELQTPEARAKSRREANEAEAKRAESAGEAVPPAVAQALATAPSEARQAPPPSPPPSPPPPAEPARPGRTSGSRE